MISQRWARLGSVFAAFVVALLPIAAAAQASGASTHSVTVRVTDEHEGTPLPGATVVVEGSTPLIGATADASGLARLTGVGAGARTLVVSFVGYETARVAVTLPLADPEAPIEVEMEEDEESLDNVVVGATRTSRTIAQIPTRVETIAGEEIDEKISMEPSNITMLLNESPGIVVQQTSAVSANASIRIQGLDGRYTQLLKDGFPLYGGFSGGLSLLQVPPLDLRQVEIIKGPASTLYGGDAIAGLVNLVTKTPEAAPERSLLLNATSAGGLDVGAFLSGRNEDLGYTLLASANRQRPYDGDGDAFTNLPRTQRVTLAPRGYVYSGATTIWAGLSGTAEEREGGDIAVIEDGAAGYAERSTSYRLTSQARLDRTLASGDVLTLKYSGSAFDRSIELPGYAFGGLQTTSYSEASGLFGWGAHDVVAGLDLRTDAFDESDARGLALGERLDYGYRVAGAFVQDTWDVSEQLAVELGLRGDLHDEYGAFVLPRASALVRVSPQVSLRATGGLGYKAPTVFLEPSESRAFQGVLPLDETVEAETSEGVTVDVNLQTVLGGRVTLSLNQAAYLTHLDDALVPASGAEDGLLRYQNASGPVVTRGLETNLRLGLDDFKLFLGYVYLDATEATPEASGDTRQSLALTPAHKTYSVLVWEQHARGRIGLEAYYTGPQTLPDGERTPGYWVTGIMGEWRVGPARLFLNLENILDTQQTNYSPVVIGPRATPTFADVWAPTDGFIANGGVKLAL
ncbi:TonB-dependent receptor [Rubricoccus marinus]|uniref:TonB-dependent receptor n=1 Tax=Rubricoccus marinus TaxID=716817 RepID=UPI000B97DBD8|nr:TonB-dependent receptor [Rubricoccus marinus]